MSVRLPSATAPEVWSYPTRTLTTNKQFFFNVKDARGIERGIGGYYRADTTVAYVNPNTTRATLKTYTFTASAYSNKIRVRVYGYITGGSAYVYLNINGTDVASATVSNTSEALLIDYIGNISPSSSITIKIDVNAESVLAYTLYITKVYIIAGFGLDSTTAKTIITITLDTANTDKYILRVNGNFVYRLGVRWWISGNRKTSTASTIYSSLANEIQGYYSPSASDDGDNISNFLTIRTGDYPGDNASFTISGYVGASGDVVIITGIYLQVVLRGNITDSLNNWSGWSLLIKEKGLVYWTQELLSIDGGSYANLIYLITLNGYKQIYGSGTGTDVVSTWSFPVNDSPEVALHASYNEDINSKSFVAYVNIIVLGV